MEINPLIPIGTTVKIEKSKIENELPKKILDGLPKIINGNVIDYKMTDGMGIGYVLMTENKLKIWIFNNELNETTKKEYQIYDADNSTMLVPKALILKINKIDYEINGNRNVKTILNPINIISWLIFTIKDIF